MQYMLAIYMPHGGEAPAEGSPEAAAEHARWGAYTQELRDAGLMLAGDALQPPDAATTVRVRNDERLTADGPFAETKEWLAGYYLIDAADIDVAIDWAARMPNITYGSVEVRPVMVLPDM
jgi:hypothetical protein